MTSSSSSSSSAGRRLGRGGWALALLLALALAGCRAARPVPEGPVRPGELGAGVTTVEVIPPPGAPPLPPPAAVQQVEKVAEAAPSEVVAPAATEPAAAPPAAKPADVPPEVSGPFPTAPAPDVAAAVAAGELPADRQPGATARKLSDLDAPATPPATPAPAAAPWGPTATSTQPPAGEPAGKPPGQPADQAGPTRPPPPPIGPRIALLPLTNRSSGAAPTKAVAAALREQLVKRGFQVAADEEVLRVLAEKRVRYTGGIDAEIAEALRQEAGVEGVVIADLEAYVVGPPCKFAITARMVSTKGGPVIRWTDAIARGGADRPGLLGLGVILGVERLRDQVLGQLVASLHASFVSPRPVLPCPDASGRDPDRMFRSPLALDLERRSIAVLPFVNQTGRRDAGELLALRLLVPLANAGLLEVVEPGVVRREMLSYRLGAGGGISLDDARVILELIHADLVLSGTVRTFEDAAGSSGAPRVDFSLWVLDRKTGELVWSSTAGAAGDDGVFFFGLGQVTTASGLACTIAKQAIGRLLEDRKPPAPPPPEPQPAAPAQPPPEPPPAAPEPPAAAPAAAPPSPGATAVQGGDAGFAQAAAGAARSASR